MSPRTNGTTSKTTTETTTDTSRTIEFPAPPARLLALLVFNAMSTIVAAALAFRLVPNMPIFGWRGGMCDEAIPGYAAPSRKHELKGRYAS